MWVIVACSVVALAIIIERFWALQTKRVIPKHLVAQVWHMEKKKQLNRDYVRELRRGSPLGNVLAAGIINRDKAREIMKEAIEETGRHVVHELERYLNTLGTIATITPLLGLLGTVFGMIDVFTELVQKEAIGKVQELSGGISKALSTTAGGLVVGIPSLMLYRYFRGRIDELVVYMEQEAIKLVEVMHGTRESSQEDSA